MLAPEQIPDQFAAFVVSFELGATALMLHIAVLIILAESHLDVSPAILLPAARTVDFSGVHYGVAMVSGPTVVACTPPVGICLNVCVVISRIGIGAVLLGAAPFLLANVLLPWVCWRLYKCA